MTRRAATLLLLAAFALPTGLALAAAAPPAEARGGAPAQATRPVVEDPEGTLSADQAAALRDRLAGVRLAGVAVVFSRREGDGIERQAEDAFRRLKLGAGALTVAIAVEDRKVAAHVGKDLRQRGVDREAIQATIGARFKSHARAGRYDEGAFALVEGLAERAARPAARQPDRTADRPVGPATEPRKDEPLDTTSAVLGLIFIALMFGVPLAIVGAIVWFVWRLFRQSYKEVTAEAIARTRVRLTALEAARDRIMAGVVALDGAIALARGAEDPSQATATAVMAEAQDFSTRVDGAGQALAAGKDIAAQIEADALEMIALNLEVSIAALRTAYQDGSHDAFRDALKLGRRWKLVDAQVAHLVEKDLGAGPKRAVLVDLVAKARQALTAVPIDAAHATELITEAESTLEALGLTKIEEPATSATSRVPAAASPHNHLDCWDVSPVHVCAVSHAVDHAVHVASHSHGHHDHHDHHDDDHSSGHAESSSGSSWWGSSSSGSDSGSSSWSSSSDDDSNRWSSSDSGSSSWDSGSSSSSDSSSSSGSDSW